MSGWKVVVQHFRRVPVRGDYIDLLPYAPAHSNAVVRLRNLPEVRYFLNQDFESTLESQQAWAEDYFKRSNDIFWVLQDKLGMVVGCNRLYDISADVLEKGSLIVDPKFSRASPIALEADLRVLRVAFFEIGVEAVITRTRDDNIKMRSMNARFGFKEISRTDVRGVEFPIYSLRKHEFCPDAFESILSHWRRRIERKKP